MEVPLPARLWPCFPWEVHPHPRPPFAPEQRVVLCSRLRRCPSPFSCGCVRLRLPGAECPGGFGGNPSAGSASPLLVSSSVACVDLSTLTSGHPFAVTPLESVPRLPHAYVSPYTASGAPWGQDCVCCCPHPQPAASRSPITTSVFLWRGALSLDGAPPAWALGTPSEASVCGSLPPLCWPNTLQEQPVGRKEGLHSTGSQLLGVALGSTCQEEAGRWHPPPSLLGWP